MSVRSLFRTAVFMVNLGGLVFLAVIYLVFFLRFVIYQKISDYSKERKITVRFPSSLDN